MSPKKKRVRPHVTIRVSLELREAIKEYATKHHTNVSQLTLEYWRKLIQEETNQEAEQL